MKYRIAFSHGYLSGEYATKAEARRAFAAIVAESKAEARRRWKSAAVIRSGPDHAAIHAMNHADSPMWARFAISSFR